MEEPLYTKTEDISQVKFDNHKRIMLTVIALALMAVAVAGVYIWQHSKVDSLNKKLASLQNQADSKLDQSTSPKYKVVTTTFTYKSFGMTLVLPKTYGVIVNVDGNKGGAAGATLRIASVKGANIFSDASYQGIQIDVDNGFTSLPNAVSAEESMLDDERGSGSTVNRNYKVSDTTVAGLPAKLLKADGLDEYQGQLSVYLVGIGSGANSFLYTITANGTQNNSFPILDAVLKGIIIKPANL
jgi:hypothetical protein